MFNRIFQLIKAWFPLNRLRPRQQPISSQNKAISVKDDCIREVSFFTRRGGLLKIGGGSGTLSKIKRGDQKIFQIKKGGSLIFC